MPDVALYHVVLICDLAVGITPYINGVASSLITITAPTNLANTFPTLKIGNWQGNIDPSYFFKGALIVAMIEGIASGQQIADFQRNVLPSTSFIYQTFAGIISDGGTVTGTQEQCLVHQRGAVIRTDGNNNRYIVT